MEDEKEVAAFYQEHKDDEDLWGDPAPAPSADKGRHLGVTITVRLTPAEADLMRASAKRANISYSELVRRAVRAYTSPRFSLAQSPEWHFALGAEALTAMTAGVFVRGIPEATSRSQTLSSISEPRSSRS